MAAIAGIVASFVAPIIEIGKCFAPSIKRQFTYLCCFKSNIRSLEDGAQNLLQEKVALQREIEAPENNGRSRLPDVQTWLENADRKIEEAGEISNLNVGCWDIKSRYQLSKKAVKKAGEMEQLMEDCKKFDGKYCSSPPPAARVPIPLEGAYEFQSRKQIEDGIVEALRANEIRTVGICGLGGVGKTTMAKRITSRTRDIFKEIPMAVVSQEVDMLKIQKQIAESLDLKLEQETLAARANKLRTRLACTDAKRILIVLDDVWETLKLDDLGIPSENEWCTILLTSRNRDVLNKMGVQRICEMAILSSAEAWSLFRGKVGTCVDNENLSSIAQSVAEECKGLPIALVTVGAALKDKDITYWEGALEQLKSFYPVDLPGVIQEVYNPLKLSYTNLESGNAKSLFLLCSIFPEDVDISLEVLVSYCMGLRIFRDSNFHDTSAETLEKVRKRIFLIMDRLKDSFLLLEGRDKHHVRMHDVVRDVAIYIASREAKEGAVDIKSNSMHLSREYTYEWVSVSSKKKSNLLRIHANGEAFEIEEFSLFKEMKELNVLSFENISLKSLAMETRLRKNLRTLRLEDCELGSLSVVGELSSLEILCCLDCSGIEELPVEIGKLSHLKLFDFSECSNLQRVPPGVVSNLIELEEFKMLKSFGGWESAAAVQGQERRINASLNEFECLSKLTSLEIQIDDINLAAEEIHFSPKIDRYHIRIGDVPWYERPDESTLEIRCMLMKLRREIKLGSWVLRFLRSANLIYLDLPEAHNMKSLISTDDESKSFGNLEFLGLENLPNLEEILHGEVLDSSNSFKNLRQLGLSNMPALKHLCKRPYGSVVSLDKLERIRIEKCSNLVNLFSFTMDGQNENAVNHVDDLLCIQNVHYPMLEKLKLEKLDKLEVIWNAPIPEGSNSFCKLKKLKLSHLPAMTHL